MADHVTSTENGEFNTVLSFKPLLNAFESIVREGREGMAELYGHLLDKINQFPELTEPITDLSIVKKHRVLIEQMMATVFPVTLSDRCHLFAVSIPFTYQAIYSSALFRTLFLNENGDFINVPKEETEKTISLEKKANAYQVILQKFYGVKINGKVSSIHPYKDPSTGLDKFMELEIDANFIDVKHNKELPPMPEDCASHCYRISDILNNPEILDWLPLKDFSFEGMAIIHIREVTERETINNIKNYLLTLQSFADAETFRKLQTEIQNLAGVPGIQVGVTPFFHVNNHFVFSEVHNANSIFLKTLSSNEEKNEVCQGIQQFFEDFRTPLAIPEILDESLLQYSFLKHLQGQGWKGIIICPLLYNGKVTGILEIATDQADKLDQGILLKIESAIPLFELALAKSSENLESEIDRVIKEQFTAIQSSVEWRFTEAAINYLTKIQHDEDTKLEDIVFANVYPLYGAIDVRNSSTERNHAIQQDMLEQLKMAGAIIKKAQEQTYFPLLEEIDFKIKKYIHSVSNIVLSDDEISINLFLKEEIVQLFNHLRAISPSLEEDIASYFAAVTTVVDMLYHHRKNFDDTITYINKAVAKFIDKEQQSAQKIFPHYFERFVTDGLDFNIYIGQSISPQTPFNDFYLKNLKIWQLSTLAKAAQLSKKLEKDIPIPLQTTQLILAHSHPISISFRPAERKFDVDGAYNIRYEIIKKRIDKVRIKDTNERLTQPGKIAIVYSQPKEATEYLEYIDYLQNQAILKGEIETYELEELQGVSGLKALRVSIMVSEENEKENKTEKIPAVQPDQVQQSKSKAGR